MILGIHRLGVAACTTFGILIVHRKLKMIFPFGSASFGVSFRLTWSGEPALGVSQRRKASRIIWKRHLCCCLQISSAFFSPNLNIV